MKKLLPIILAVVGLGAGVGAGLMLQPAPEPEEHDEAHGGEGHDAGHGGEYAKDKGSAQTAETIMMADIVEEPLDPDAVYEYVKLSKQFVVPVIKKDRVTALVVMTVSLEAKEGLSETILARQPKLRDQFLQVMFAHANSGGFDGAFTTGQSMRDLRGSLREAARNIVGEDIASVLIEEIVKQQN